MNAASLWQTLIQHRDELRVKAHLLEMEIKEQWLDLEEHIESLEARLVQKARQLGVAEEHYFVGSDQEIQQLIQRTEQFKQHIQQSDREHS